MNVEVTVDAGPSVGATYVGPDEEYGSTDPGDGDRSIQIQRGETVQVSSLKAAQMQADFPDWFEFDGKVEAPQPAEATAADAEPPEAPVALGVTETPAKPKRKR